jgi:hypothetical protein
MWGTHTEWRHFPILSRGGKGAANDYCPTLWYAPLLRAQMGAGRVLGAIGLAGQRTGKSGLPGWPTGRFQSATIVLVYGKAMPVCPCHNYPTDTADSPI